MNIEELKRLAEAAIKAVETGTYKEFAIARTAFGSAANPAAVLELIRQRDELLAALRDFSQYVHAEQCSTDGAVHYCTSQINRLAFKARAAIAKAEG